MANESEGDRQWIVEPPGPGQIALQVSCGEGVVLTDDQEAALGELLRSLEARDPEVTGHATAWPCDQHSTWCRQLRCKSVSCTGELTCGAFKQPLTTSAGMWTLGGTFSATPQ